jgi:hypothetical protein
MNEKIKETTFLDQATLFFFVLQKQKQIHMTQTRIKQPECNKISYNSGPIWEDLELPSSLSLSLPLPSSLKI